MNKQGFVGLLLLLVVVFAVAIGGAFLYIRYTNKRASISQSSTSNHKPTAVLTGQEAILYAVSQFTVTNNDYDTLSSEKSDTYKENLETKNNEQLNIGYFFSNSDPNHTKTIIYQNTLDGKYFLRHNQKTLEVSSSDNLIFNPIVTTSDGTLSNITISPENKIAYTITTEDTEKMYIVGIDGNGQKLIKTVGDDNHFDIYGFDSRKNQLYWSTSHVGFVEDGIRATLNSDYSIKKEENYEVSLEQPLFTSDFKKAYYRDEETIIEYDNETSKKKVLFTPKKDQENNVVDILLSPRDDKLVFVNEVSSHPNGNYNQERTIYMITLSDGKVTSLVNTPQEVNLTPTSWSPSGRYIWIDTFMCHSKPCGFPEGNTYLFDTEIMKLIPFFEVKDRTDPSNTNRQIKQSVQFLGWTS